MTQKHFLRRQWLGATLAALSVPQLGWTEPKRGSPTLGSAFDSSSLQLGTKLLAGDDLRGQVLVLYWWASWCSVCARQSPLMQDLHQAQRGKGLSVLGLSVDQDVSQAQRYLQDHGLTFPSVGLTNEVRATLSVMPSGVPTVWVIDPQGHIVHAHTGLLSAKEVMALAHYRA